MYLVSYCLLDIFNFVNKFKAKLLNKQLLLVDLFQFRIVKQYLFEGFLQKKNENVFDTLLRTIILIEEQMGLTQQEVPH